MPAPSTPAEAGRLRGNAAFSRGDWDGAIAAYTAALSHTQSDARLYSNRSAAYLAKHKAVAATGVSLRGLVQLAVADATSATTYRPRWPDGWYRLYAAHCDAGAMPSALRALQNGLERCPDSPVLKDALESHAAFVEGPTTGGEEKQSPATTHQPPAEQPRQETLHLYQQQQQHQPPQSQQPTQQRQQHEQQQQHEQDQQQQQTSNDAEAAATAEAAAAAPPSSSSPSLPSLTDSPRGVRPSLSPPAMQPAAGATSCEAAAADAAVRTPRTARRLSESDAARLAANDAFRAGDWAAAIEGYSRSVALAVGAGVHPDRRAYSNRSAAWLRRAIDTDEAEAFAKAVEDADLCIALDKTWPKAWFRKGSALLEDGRPGMARSVFLEGLKYCPGNEVLLESLGQAEQVIREEGEETDDEYAGPYGGDGSFENGGGGRGGGGGGDANRGASADQGGRGGRSGRGRDGEAGRRGGQGRDGGHDGAGGHDPRAFISAKESPLHHSSPKLSSAASTKSASPALPKHHGAASATPAVDEVLPLDLHHQGSTAPSTRVSASDASNLPNPIQFNGASNSAPPPPSPTSSLGRTSPRQEVGRTASPPSPMDDAIAGGSNGEGSDTGSHATAGDASIARNRTSSSSRGSRNNSRGFPSSPVGAKARRSPSRSSSRSSPPPHRMPRQSPPPMYQQPRQDEGEEGRAGEDDARIPGPKQSLYEVLNVEPDASDASIRRSYYLAARELHPDKNPDDPDATIKFQRVSDAYQILSNPESRALYDKHGEEGLEKGGIDAVDPQTLFAIVFGSDQFISYIGELKLASLASNVDEDGKAPDEKVLVEVQEDRVRRLVQSLLGMLRPWVNGEKQEFIEWAKGEVDRLADTNFGADLLATVGNVYVHRVDITMGKGQVFGLHSLLKDASYRRQKIRAQMKANAATRAVVNRQRRLHDRVMRLNREGEAISETEAEEVAAEMARNAVDMMWKISVLDIRDVLESVIEKVLEPQSVSREEVELWTSTVGGDEGGEGAASRESGQGAGEAKRRKGEASDDVFGESAREVHVGGSGGAEKSGRLQEGQAKIIAARASGIRTLGKMMLQASRRRPRSERNAETAAAS